MSLLDAATSPSGLVTGVRSANKRPVLILGGIGLAVVIIIGMVAMDRAQNSAGVNNNPELPSTSTGEATSSTISDLTKTYGSSGFIAAEADPVPVPVAAPLGAPSAVLPETSTAAPLNAPYTAGTEPERGLRGRPLEYQQQVDQFSKKKAQLFEAALVATSSIELPTQVNAQPQLADGSAETPEEQLTQMRENIANQPPGATYANRVAAVERLQKLSGQVDSTDDDSSGSGNEGADNGVFSDRTTDDTWTLKSSLQAPSTPYVVRTGFVVPGIMVGGINSDLPGQIKGQVSQDVYDTATGYHCLIPQGTIAVGTYNSDIAFGQDRVQIAWQRLILPNGHAINIGGMPGADSAGYSGLHDQVDHHWRRILGAALAMSVITAGFSLSQDDSSATNGENRSASSALSEGLGQNLGNASTQIFQKNLAIQPTNIIRPGMRFNIMVQQDMVFSKPYAKCDYRRTSR